MALESFPATGGHHIGKHQGYCSHSWMWMRSPASQDKEVKLGHSDIQNSNRGRGGLQQRNQRGQKNWEVRGKSEKAKATGQPRGIGRCSVSCSCVACWEMWSLPRGAGNCSSLPQKLGLLMSTRLTTVTVKPSPNIYDSSPPKKLDFRRVKPKQVFWTQGNFPSNEGCQFP